MKEKTLTITFDNGQEFVHHQGMSGALNSKIYFAKPYHSWDRYLNEHINGLIQKYLPPNIPFPKFSSRMLQEIENSLNNRPRKVLDFLTPNEVFFSDTSSFHNLSHLKREFGLHLLHFINIYFI